MACQNRGVRQLAGGHGWQAWRVGGGGLGKARDAARRGPCRWGAKAAPGEGQGPAFLFFNSFVGPPDCDSLVPNGDNVNVLLIEAWAETVL